MSFKSSIEAAAILYILFWGIMMVKVGVEIPDMDKNNGVGKGSSITGKEAIHN